MSLYVSFFIHGCLCFLCFFGFSLNLSIVCWIVLMSMVAFSSMVFHVGLFCISLMISLLISSFLRSYLLVESVFCCLCTFFGIWLWNVVYIGRWSDSGGEIVPAVASVCVSVVSIVSSRVAVLWVGSYRVGVVIVVCKLFSLRKLWNW